MKKRKTNVIIVAPASPATGGVASINEVVLKNLDDLKYNIILLNTANFRRKNNPKFAVSKLFFQVLLAIEFIYLLIRFNNSIIHMSVTSYTSFYRNAVLILLSALFNNKKILHIHGGSFDKFYNNCKKIQKKFVNFILEKGDCIIALSNYWKKFLNENTGINENKIEILHNCYSLDLINIDKPKLKTESRRKKDKLELLFVGALGKRKGVFDLLEISTRLKKMNANFVMYLAGGEEDPGSSRKIKRIIDEKTLGDYVRLLGEIKDIQKLYYFAKCDIFILPSYNENFPIVVLEAMRAGLPVITTPVGALPEIFQDGKNGFLIKPGDIDLFVSKILYLMTDQNVRQIMSKINIDKAMKDFNPLKYPQKLTRIYDRILG